MWFWAVVVLSLDLQKVYHQFDRRVPRPDVRFFLKNETHFLNEETHFLKDETHLLWNE